MTYGINLFYLKGDNMIMTMPIDGKPRNVNTGEIENYGLEVEASYALGAHWNLNANHSWLHMKNAVLGAPELSRSGMASGQMERKCRPDEYPESLYPGGCKRGERELLPAECYRRLSVAEKRRPVGERGEPVGSAL